VISSSSGPCQGSKADEFPGAARQGPREDAMVRVSPQRIYRSRRAQRRALVSSATQCREKTALIRPLVSDCFYKALAFRSSDFGSGPGSGGAENMGGERAGWAPEGGRGREYGNRRPAQEPQRGRRVTLRQTQKNPNGDPLGLVCWWWGGYPHQTTLYPPVRRDAEGCDNVGGGPRRSTFRLCSRRKWWPGFGYPTWDAVRFRVSQPNKTPLRWAMAQR
jgi:hypothetical protein